MEAVSVQWLVRSQIVVGVVDVLDTALVQQHLGLVQCGRVAQEEHERSEAKADQCRGHAQTIEAQPFHWEHAKGTFSTPDREHVQKYVPSVPDRAGPMAKPKQNATSPIAYTLPVQSTSQNQSLSSSLKLTTSLKN